MEFDQIKNAFFPASEITDPEFFVGRKDEVKESLLGLNEESSFLAIYGLRGVGKSSIAQQIKNVSQGDKTLIRMHDLEKFLPRKGFNYLTHFVSCDSYVKDINTLIKRIMFGDDENPSLLSLTKEGSKKAEEIRKSAEGGGAINLMGVEAGGKGSSEVSYSIQSTDDLIQQFKSVLGKVRQNKQDKSGLLIIVDEFDVIQDKSGFSSLVKTCSNEYIKFCVSGIADNISDLISDHTSILRQIHTIHVKKMDETELTGIIERAESHVSNEISFDEEAKNDIVKHAEGFPYFVHLFGKEALIEAFENKETHIDKDTVDRLKTRVCEGRMKTVYEDVYQSAVKSSPQREVILKLLSEEDEDEIFTNPIYDAAKELGVSNPSQLMKELTKPQDGQINVLTKVRGQYYRFTDPVFKVYTRIRNWKYEN